MAYGKKAINMIVAFNGIVAVFALVNRPLTTFITKLLSKFRRAIVTVGNLVAIKTDLLNIVITQFISS